MKHPNELLLPAIRGHIGNWIYYATFLRMEQIVDVHITYGIYSSNVLKEMIQKEVSKRAISFTDYLLNQAQPFFNSLVIGVQGGSPDWYELEIDTNPYFDEDVLPQDLNGILGILRLDGTQILFAIDGQHRVQGIKQALKTNDELKNGRSERHFRCTPE